MLQYVDQGGNLLVTGPVDRDEHWQAVPRASALGITGQVEPLVFHNAELRLPNQRIALAFGQQQQNWLDSLRFADGSTLKEIAHGRGRIYWSAYPVELAEDLESAADLYGFVAGRLNIAPPFTSLVPIPAGVLIFPTVLSDSILYVIVSDADQDAVVNIRDRATDAPLTFRLPAQHAAIAVIGKKERRLLTKYGF